MLSNPLSVVVRLGVERGGLGVLLAAAVCGGAARADVITFDNLLSPAVGTHMPAEYGTLRWGTSDWYYMAAGLNPSGTYLALGGRGTFVGGVPGGGDFYLDGADFWSRRAGDANGDFYFVLYHNGVTVYNGLVENNGRQRFDSVHRTFVPNYTGPISAFALAFDSNGTDWNHLAMDNLRIRPVNPPPPAGCSPADVVDGGGVAPGDGTIDGADFIAFINSFAIGDAAVDPVADITGGGDAAELPDGTIDGTDFIAFINAFATGC